MALKIGSVFFSADDNYAVTLASYAGNQCMRRTWYWGGGTAVAPGPAYKVENNLGSLPDMGCNPKFFDKVFFFADYLSLGYI